MRHRTIKIGFLVVTAFALLGSASAQAASPWWHVTSITRPAHLAPGEEGQVVVTLDNVGTAPVNGKTSQVKIEDVLPAGLEKIAPVEAVAGYLGQAGKPSCVLGSGSASPHCTFAGIIPPYSEIEIRINVKVKAGAEDGELNEIRVSGGGAPSLSVSRPIAIDAEAAGYGFSDFELTSEEEGGVAPTQAGSHPLQLTTSLALNQKASTFNGSGGYEVRPVASPKDVDVELPPGLLGNPSPFATCPLTDFFGDPSGNDNLCPASTVLGVATVTIDEPGLGGVVTFPSTPIVNLEPAFGEPARFGFLLPVTPVFIETSLRDGEGEAGEPDYGVTAASLNTSQTAALLSANLTFWGVPGDPIHDPQRGSGCLRLAEEEGTEDPVPCTSLNESSPPAFQTLPGSCSGQPLQTLLRTDDWVDPASYLQIPPELALPTLDGCNQVPFGPTIDAEPTAESATSPTGFKVGLDVNDEGLTSPKAGALAQSEMKKAVVTLPEGFTTNPSVAEGLKACSLPEYQATRLATGTGCTEESKVGSLEVESPLVKQKLTGSLYIAKQHENPFGSLLALYMVFRNPELGIVIKAAGKVESNPTTGQLTTTFDNLPQLPFSHFHLEFRSGQRAPLITPPACGTYAVKAKLYPWSEPATPREESSAFLITSGPEGLPCPSGGTPPFHPLLEAGTQNNAAGTYSPFYARISRKDSEQEITHFSIKLPPGVIGKLAGVAECSDAQIAAARAREHEGGGAEELEHPSCPANSEVGSTLVGTGVGNVLAYAPGKLYLAGPYHGAQLSIVAITAAKVGPFDLGTVVVRQALKVNPETAEVSAEGAGSDPIPHIVDGIPVHLRDIRIHVDRPNFVLNPTSCAPTSTASTVLGSGTDFASEADDVPVTVTSPFQAASCASLGFKPKLALSLSGGKTHRGGLPAFKAVLTYPKGGAYANIARSEVTLPASEILEQGHLEKVCPKSIFQTGKVQGENCPANSIYGRAKAWTPLLSEPLEGPVYLRTGYGTVLPQLVAALNGKQISVDLAGKIDSVHKKGSEVSRIRNTFEVVPDAPVEKFVLEMQGGSKGLLVNKTNVCKGSHKAQVLFTAQNGKLAPSSPPLVASACKGAARKSALHREHR